MNFSKDKPTVTAMYLVDRDKQGKAYRWYNAETDQWGRCGFDMQEALDNKETTAVDFYPWVGPLTGPNFKTNKPVVQISEDEKPSKPARGYQTKKKVAATRMAKSPAPVAPKVKATKAPKSTHADGTVWYRADRGKWIAQWAGKQEAARPTAEACLAFLKKKYNHVGTVIPKE